ncbi:unnamed protein product [Caretta caretta]
MDFVTGGETVWDADHRKAAGPFTDVPICNHRLAARDQHGCFLSMLLVVSYEATFELGVFQTLTPAGN